MALNLSKRLTALAQLVPSCDSLADIGTDHAYIPILLCQNGTIRSALAMDVNPGPLERADEHIQMYEMTDRIQTRLSDGLAALKRGEADTIVIAGMGGALMRRILAEADPEVLGSITNFVFQPQSEIREFRTWTREHNFIITKEDMVEEDGKYYPMMLCKCRVGGTSILSDSILSKLCGRLLDREKPVDMELCDAYGPQLIRNRHPVLLEWLHRELENTEKILAGLEKQNPSDSENRTAKRYAELLDQKKHLEDAIAFIMN